MDETRPDAAHLVDEYVAALESHRTELKPAAAPPYDPNRYQRPSVTVDLVIFTVYKRDLLVLLIRRGRPPFKDQWALPGGFVRIHEPLDETARRELVEETGLEGEDVYLEQLYTFGAPDRDPRTRVITVAYFALIRDGKSRALHAATDAVEVRWFKVYDLPPLAFDHHEIIDTALRRLRSKLEWTPVAFRLLPAQFTMTQLRTVYEAILNQDLGGTKKRNFSKKLLNRPSDRRLIEEVPNARVTGPHRPARLYRFVEERPYDWGATAPSSGPNSHEESEDTDD
jgi:8-oxo-dGTP diphosphatase